MRKIMPLCAVLSLALAGCAGYHYSSPTPGTDIPISQAIGPYAPAPALSGSSQPAADAPPGSIVQTPSGGNSTYKGTGN